MCLCRKGPWCKQLTLTPIWVGSENADIAGRDSRFALNRQCARRRQIGQHKPHTSTNLLARGRAKNLTHCLSGPHMHRIAFEAWVPDQSPSHSLTALETSRCAHENRPSGSPKPKRPKPRFSEQQRQFWNLRLGKQRAGLQREMTLGAARSPPVTIVQPRGWGLHQAV